MALKHAFDRNLQAFFEQTLIYSLIKLDRVGDVDEVIDIIYYNESNFLDKKRFWTALYGKFSEKTEGKMTTIAQQMKEQGVEEGMEKGIEKVAKRLLAERQDLTENDLVKWVHKMTGLSEERIRELRKSH